MSSATFIGYQPYGNNSAPQMPMSSSNRTYTNPVLDSTGADPWVVRDGSYYYLMFTNNDNITMYRSKTLT